MDEHTQMIQRLVGVWRLVSSEFRTASGQTIHPLGEDATGQAIFSESGYVSAQLMRQGRPAFASGDQAAGTPQQHFDQRPAEFTTCESTGTVPKGLSQVSPLAEKMGTVPRIAAG